MNTSVQTLGQQPLSRFSVGRGGSFTAIGARAWKRLIESVQAHYTLAAERRAERELLALAAEYESSMPAFAAELRAAHTRRR